MQKPLTFLFSDDGKVPNNPALPVLVYEAALGLRDATDPAAEIETLFKANGWGRDMWRNGVYPFVHYHSMIHEALGIARGHARIQLGGHQGQVLDLKPGDVAILPAGTGHQRLSATDDFLVVGGYPPEGTYNLCRGDNPAERDKALQTIPRVALPSSDPVLGKEGGLPVLWTR
ncbi:hypothetical protein DW352_13515 [Pseudolabrys taiwanensis]|uniref:Cupin n=1 Tax=Pseudolabrys taiwanensis TaxID=331696 RepID=A0A345ZWZ0_9HYPH|nr:hypothetical protein [Pseudolabrys taiwanensis]AXK81437.1 hypothetical protein DW352_13515 [Pseudolabrys taiwanensis]